MDTNNVDWKPYERVRQYEYVLETIREMIAIKQLKPGDKLPSERELASKLEVGRASIKEAFRILEILGLIDVKHGDGSYLRRNNFQFFESFASNVELFGELTAETMVSFLDFRSVWEIKCVKLAAKNATKEDIRMMDIEIERMKNAQHDETLFKSADINFHNLMCLASKDKAIMLVVQGLRNILISFFDGVYPHICSDPKRSQRSLDTHYNIICAINEHDELKAVSAMEEHLKEAKINLLQSYNSKKKE
jgi:GntR family transcriptional regulator, transcriptional repressor for pyruvate dehydrogenase complex